MAKAARAATVEAGSAISRAVGSGMRWYAVGLPTWLVRVVDCTSHTRAIEVSASRCASCSVRSGVCDHVKALPKGLSSPIGMRTASTSNNQFSSPSIAMSRRAENRCWCTGANTPGAISGAWRLVEPGTPPPTNTMPVALASTWIDPSR